MKKISRKYVFTILVGLTLLLAWLVVNRSSNWDGTTRVSMVVPDEEDVMVLVFDPFTGSIARVSLPGDTELEAAGGMGVWRVGSLWELGQSEGLGGELLANTISKSLGLPVEHWGSGEMVGFGKGKFAALKALFSVGESSLPLPDRVKLFAFAFGVDGGGIYDVELKKTGYLQYTQISGGDEGYRARSRMPTSLRALFSVPEISEEAQKIMVVNQTGEWGYAKYVSGVVDGLGGRVLSISDTDEVDSDCEILYKKESVTLKVLAEVLGCSESSAPVQGSFDLEVVIGKRFLERF
jgi:hypothetical protein